MTRDELVTRTRQLIAEGERLDAQPAIGALRTWLQLSDDLLSTAWGPMDRYHLSWLMVGRPKEIVRGREMTPTETAEYVREVASQKTAALRMSLDAVERQHMPFRGETAGIATGQGMGEVPATEADTATGDTATDDPRTGPGVSHRGIPLDPEVARRLADQRREADRHRDHGERRAPRVDRLER